MQTPNDDMSKNINASIVSYGVKSWIVESMPLKFVCQSGVWSFIMTGHLVQKINASTVYQNQKR